MIVVSPIRRIYHCYLSLLLIANPKKLICTVANPARGLLNREKRTKKSLVPQYCVDGIGVKKNLNASRPSEHPPVSGENVKTFRWEHRLQRQNLFMAFRRVPLW